MNKQSQIITNALSIDVEDYFQVSAFEEQCKPSLWSKFPARVEKNTYKILSLLENKNHNEKKTLATFFVLGWVAEKFPNLVKDIVLQGHELASHGYMHQRIEHLSKKEFYQDISKTKKLLEDISGKEIKGYRAPSYSITQNTLWAHDELLQCGYIYSSSIYPIKHDLYGIPNAPRFPFYSDNGLLEIPITTHRIGNINFPAGGGGYFRFFPYFFSKWLINQINSREKQSSIFYFHPWEVDPNQPKIQNAPLKSRFRHYLNLNKTEQRLTHLIKDFKWDRIDNVFVNNKNILGKE